MELEFDTAELCEADKSLLILSIFACNATGTAWPSPIDENVFGEIDIPGKTLGDAP